MSLFLRCVKCNAILLEKPTGLFCPNCNETHDHSKTAPSTDPQPSWEDKVVSLLTEIRDALRDGVDQP